MSEEAEEGVPAAPEPIVPVMEDSDCWVDNFRCVDPLSLSNSNVEFLRVATFMFRDTIPLEVLTRTGRRGVGDELYGKLCALVQILVLA